MALKHRCVRAIRGLLKGSKTSKDEDLLQLLFIHRGMTPDEIAKQLNQSVESVKERLIKYDLMQPNGDVIPGTFLGIFTGRFHYAKADLIAAIKTIKRTEKVIKRSDELYTQTKSINARILKEIIAEMDQADDDTEEFSAGAALGMTRKETYQAGAHFGIVLYDIDMVYAERIDYLLKRIIERGDEFYFDAQSDPANWYPHRNDKAFGEHIVGRTLGGNALKKLKETNGGIHIGV